MTITWSKLIKKDNENSYPTITNHELRFSTTGLFIEWTLPCWLSLQYKQMDTILLKSCFKAHKIAHKKYLLCHASLSHKLQSHFCLGTCSSTSTSLWNGACVTRLFPQGPLRRFCVSRWWHSQLRIPLPGYEVIQVSCISSCTTIVTYETIIPRVQINLWISTYYLYSLNQSRMCWNGQDEYKISIFCHRTHSDDRIWVARQWRS